MQIIRNIRQPSLTNLDPGHLTGVGKARSCAGPTGPLERSNLVRVGRGVVATQMEVPPPSFADYQTLCVDDFPLLAVLGIVHEGFVSFAEIAMAAKSLAGPDWQPTTDVLAGTLNATLADGLMVEEPDGYVVTGQGCARLAFLVQAPLASTRGGTARTALALKVCFLGVLSDEAREAVLDDMIALQKGTLRALEHGGKACPATCACTRLWITREIERIKGEIVWLGELKVHLGDAA